MSMLAERRRKTKWVINPTKKPLWNEESNGIKFGKELMEKMGWSAGKGLGAKEQGIHEPLKVSYKNDTKGMGFKGNDNDWIEHQDEFNELLNTLSNTNEKDSEEVNKIKSLEDKSKHSRARVHYQKFTRGKDLSRYSENDLACILGVNKLKKDKSKQEEETKLETDDSSKGEFQTSFGVTTINSGSLHEYFKKKWTINKNKQENFMSHSVETENQSESVSEEKTNFTKDENVNEKLEKKEKKKEKKSKTELEKSELEKPESENTNQEENNSTDENHSQTDLIKRKKHKRKKHESLEFAESENIEKNSEEKHEKKRKNETNLEEIVIKKKKKKKDKEKNLTEILENNLSDNEILSSKSNEENTKTEGEEKKIKKKKSKSEKEEILMSTENLNQNLSDSESGRTRKKKSKSESETMEISETNFSNENEKKNHKKKHKIDLSDEEHCSRKKKIKTNSDENIENLSKNESETIFPEKFDVELEKKEKKSKKKSKSRDEETENKSNEENLESEIEKKKSKKRKKSESELIKKSESAELENSDEHVRKKKKKKHSDDSCKSNTIVDNTLDNDINNHSEVGNIETAEKISKQRKKEKKESENNNQEFDNEIKKIEKEQRKHEKNVASDKKKEKKMKNDFSENENFEGESIKKKKEKESKEKKDRKEKTKTKEENISTEEPKENKCEENANVLRTENQNGGSGKNFPDSKQSNGFFKSGQNVGGMNRNFENINNKYNYNKYTSDKVLDLIRWADIKEFRGSNLGNVLGYGFKKEYLKSSL